MPIMLCQCNRLCEEQLAEIFNDLEQKSLLPENTIKAAGQILQTGRIEPLRKSLGRASGCCGGCLPHIEKIVEKGREQAVESLPLRMPEPVGR